MSAYDLRIDYIVVNNVNSFDRVDAIRWIVTINEVDKVLNFQCWAKGNKLKQI